jgi:DNA-binding MarR family transcriptional regulator
VTREELTMAMMLALREVSALGVLHSQAVAERLAINSTDLECLDSIIMRGPLPAGELARLTGLTTGAITGIIDRLARAGFARREHDPADRRKVLVRATPAVARKIGPLFKPMEQGALSVLALYDDKELALLLDFLARSRDAALAAMAVLRAGATAAKKGGTRRTKA